MNVIVHKLFHPMLIVSSLLVMATPLAAQVYKTVDENGNVVYTDQPPSDGAKPMELRPLSIIEAPDYSEPSDAVKPMAEAEDGEDFSLRDLRRNYSDFSITRPVSEETFRDLEKAITVVWDTRYRLQSGMQVTVYLDGQEFETTTRSSVSLGRLERGEHKVMAVLNDDQGRRIASTKVVTFYVMQVSVRPRPAISPTNSGG